MFLIDVLNLVKLHYFLNKIGIVFFLINRVKCKFIAGKALIQWHKYQSGGFCSCLVTIPKESIAKAFAVNIDQTKGILFSFFAISSREW